MSDVLIEGGQAVPPTLEVSSPDPYTLGTLRTPRPLPHKKALEAAHVLLKS